MKKVNDISVSRPSNELQTLWLWCDDTLVTLRTAAFSFHEGRNENELDGISIKVKGEVTVRLGRYSSSALGGNARSELMRPGHRLHISRFKVGTCIGPNISVEGKKVQKWPKRQMTQSPTAQTFSRKIETLNKSYSLELWKSLRGRILTFLNEINLECWLLFESLFLNVLSYDHSETVTCNK